MTKKYFKILHSALFIVSTLVLPKAIIAQTAKFQASVSTDSLLMDNALQVTFTLEDAKGKNFAAPRFEGFTVLSGPNSSSSFSMVNGTTTQKISYSYQLMPKEVGQYFIEPANIEADGKTISTDPVAVTVYPNPDGIRQSQRNDNAPSIWGMDSFFGTIPTPRQAPPAAGSSKKQRKTYKL